MVLFQWGQDNWSSMIYFLLLVIFFFFYPRLMLSQIVWKLENVTRSIENMSRMGKEIVAEATDKRRKKEIIKLLDRFFDFFVVMPVSLDPAGIIRKIDHMIKNERRRFRYFVRQIAGDKNEEERASIEAGISGGIELHTLAKIMRHFLELIKQTKSYQIAMIVQMQVPLVEKMAKALFAGTKALSKGMPIGDSVGPFMVAKLISKSDRKVEIEEMIVVEKKLFGRDAILMKAKGPGGRVGNPGKAVEKLVKKKRVAKIITIDAAAKLEGEKTGSVAEGVGVAMGGIGVERSYIEDVAVKYDIPIDSIVIKMKQEEAIMPMRKSIVDAEKDVMRALRESFERDKGLKGAFMVIGVGNSSGVGNDESAVKDALKWVKRYEREMELKERKRRGRFF